MRWEDERYVRVYTRDTVDWQFLSFEAQGLLTLLLRKVDRAGVLTLGRHERAKAVAAAIGHPSRWETIGTALEELLLDRCVVINDGVLLVRNFLEAQEAKQSDKARQQKARELARDVAAMPSVTQRDVSSHGVTETPVFVTHGHTASHAVTPSRAVPNCAEPSQILASAASPQPLVLEVVEPEEPKRPADPRWKPLVSDLSAAYREATGRKYKWQGVKDGDALKALLKDEAPEDIRAFWWFALARPPKDYLHCATIAELRSKWNNIGAAMPPKRDESPCSEQGCSFGATHEWENRPVCESHSYALTAAWHAKQAVPR